jgi:alkanesulfonate monooxygenase SsuD/methylene tetrahydromethanopterin reductase-like flavin-dependent oxidoreductase (luciferase family)
MNKRRRQQQEGEDIKMQHGFILPGGDIHTIIELAGEAEEAGWDGVFISDCISIPGMETYDPWVMLAGMALHTRRVRIGAILTPLSRRRPWKVARETVSVDHLSRGRLVVPVGLGALDDQGFGKVGEATERKTRAQLLDESLEILTGLWSGQPFRFQGQHYQFDEMTFTPPPVQQPRIPIWVAGAWPREKSMQRALRYDGLLPNKLDASEQQARITPDDIRAMKTYIDARRELTTPFDIIVEGETPGDQPERAAELVRPFAQAGATWWTETRWGGNPIEEVRERIRQGPPRSA